MVFANPNTVSFLTTCRLGNVLQNTFVSPAPTQPDSDVRAPNGTDQVKAYVERTPTVQRIPPNLLAIGSETLGESQGHVSGADVATSGVLVRPSFAQLNYIERAQLTFLSVSS